MSPQLADQTMPSTSAQGAMGSISDPLLRGVVKSVLPKPGTAARSLPAIEWADGLRQFSSTISLVQPTVDEGSKALKTSAAISELRLLSGLTWELLARVFRVARRSLHFWASGKPMNAPNEEHLHRLLAVLRRADRGTATENRAVLLREYDGMIPIDLLAERKYDRFLELVGEGHCRRRIELTPLSQEALEARKPLPPWVQMDSCQDRIHREVGRGRGARTARSKRRERK